MGTFAKLINMTILKRKQFFKMFFNLGIILRQLAFETQSENI